MRFGWHLAALAAAGLLANLAAGDEGGLVARDAYVHATVPGQSVAGAYLVIESAQDARLGGGESDVARAVEVHTMSMADGVMRMRRLDALLLPARTAVKLAPGGVHLMLVGVNRVLKPGEHVRITLSAETSDGKKLAVTISAPVVRIGEVAVPAASHGGGGHR